MSAEDVWPVDVEVDGVRLAGYRWDGSADRSIVLLHAGVCDSRSWHRVAPLLTDLGAVFAYDQPGYGSTPSDGSVRDHVADAVGFLDALPSTGRAGPAWLVASSMGGAVAIDVAIREPQRVAGLVLIGPAVTGGPDQEPTDDELALLVNKRAAAARDDLDEVNRYETWFWLDGPAQPEGRVGGAARVLALAMNREILASGHDESLDESVDAWAHLGEIRCPVTVAVGAYDAAAIRSTARAIASRIPGARFVELEATAHLPYLDAPADVVDLVREAITAQ